MIYLLPYFASYFAVPLIMNSNYLYHVLTPVGLGLFMNGLIYYFRMSSEQRKTQTKNKWIPPGYVVGIIWMILLGCMGMAHYLLSKVSHSEFALWSIDFLILFSVLYPVLTGLKDNDYFWLRMSLFITVGVSYVVYSYSLRAFYYLIPLNLWVIYVNLLKEPT
jgi:tryptophan-rich sensory protein